MDCRRSSKPRSLAATLFLAAVALAVAGVLIALPGCGGCRQKPLTQAEIDAQKEKERKKKEEEEKKKPKPDFEFAKLQTLPGDTTYAVKPGHWMAVSQEMKTNNFNFTGELMSAAVDNQFRPLTLERTTYRLEMRRPASLPKGQAKHMEMTVFVPRREGQASTRANILSRLVARGGGRTVREEPNPTTTMDDYQYYFIALARNANDYNYLKAMDVTRPPRGDWGGQQYQHYRVVLPQADRYVPLASNPLMWTCVAYVLWDDIDPDWLSLDQQDALVDWLHWGGQLIVSGPGSLESLKGSFLAAHLPALPEKTVPLPQDRFDELNARFALPGKRGRAMPLSVVAAKPPEGVQLKLYGDGQFVPHTGELLAERQIGRGRIVVTSFALTNPQIVNWRNFDGFFNACLLRHPGRRFLPPAPDSDGVKTDWRDEALRGRMTDPRLITGVRYFSRDMGYLRAVQETPRPDPAEFNPEFDPEFGMTLENDPNRFKLDEVDATATVAAATKAWDMNSPPLLDRGYRAAAQSGVGGWNDVSGVSDAARRSLKEAAGISVPERSFVLKILAVYLLVLVPVNWAVFWAIGRVEWAWIAAPIIAICGALAVVRLAQLDIGFARSRTEVAVLELQPSHPRGHLTRYVALYTSLSTNYDVNFEDPNALAQPLGDPEIQRLLGQGVSTVSFSRDKNVGLRGFLVQSNSTGMLHTEEMRHIGGAISLQNEPQGLVVVNKSDVPLRDVGLVQRLPNAAGGEAIEVAWIGELSAKNSAKVDFIGVTDARALLRQWQNSPVTSTRRTEGEVSLLRLLDLARDPRRMLPGDVKLIGWTDADLGGIEIRPRPSQNTLRTIVIANLDYAPLAAPQPDENTRLAAANEDVNSGIDVDGGEDAAALENDPSFPEL